MRISLLTLLLSILACNRGEQGLDETPRTSFDAAKALRRIETQLAFGPRIPGTPAHARTGDWIVSEMRALADTVIEQRWKHVTAAGDTLPLRNILARIRPAATERVLYLAHWDTRPKADEAQTPEERALAVPGANDGASGVALLIGVAEAVKAAPGDWGVDLLFVDGEDYGDFAATNGGRYAPDVLLGSRYFAAHLPEAGYRPLFGVLWDMIGDRDLAIYQERHSVERAPEVVRRVWDQAASLGYASIFVPRVDIAVTDDHLPLLDAGLRVIDVVDIYYPAHHRPDDTIDKVSQRSLQIVGDVAVSLLRP